MKYDVNIRGQQHGEATAVEDSFTIEGNSRQTLEQALVGAGPHVLPIVVPGFTDSGDTNCKWFKIWCSEAAVVQSSRLAAGSFQGASNGGSWGSGENWEQIILKANVPFIFTDTDLAKFNPLRGPFGPQVTNDLHVTLLGGATSANISIELIMGDV